jgi:two-component system, OmpR family, response regulator
MTFSYELSRSSLHFVKNHPAKFPHPGIRISVSLGGAAVKRWRANGRATPVLILTARGSWAERVDGIDGGADDYLPKPFRMEELLARLRSIIRRSAGHASSVVTSGDLTLDERQMKVRVRGVPVALSRLEYRLVAYLLLHRGRVVPQHELDENVYGHGEEHDSNALEVLIGRVRKKLGTELIETRRGFGYIVAEPQV